MCGADRHPSDIQTLLEEDSDRQLLNTWTKHLSTMPSICSTRPIISGRNCGYPLCTEWAPDGTSILDVAKTLLKDLGDVLFGFSEDAQ